MVDRETYGLSGQEFCKIKPFDEIEITTMVMIGDLQGEITLPAIFTLLPITKYDPGNPNFTTPTGSGKQNSKLPYCHTPGSILSMQYKDAVRGIIVKAPSSKSDKQYDYFKNAVTINMSVPDKNINLRLAPNSIHMCGIKSAKQANMTVDLLINHINTIQREVDYMARNQDETQNCINFLQNNIRRDGNTLYIPDEAFDNNKVNRRILNIICTNMSEYQRVDAFMIEARWIAGIDEVVNETIKLKCMNYSMVNYNYSLGFKINRRKLSEHINTVNGFEIDYENAINHSVKITIPFEIPEGANIRRKKKKDEQPKHTLMVYESGRVTQSAPSPELAEGIYYRFNATVRLLRNMIRKQPKIRIVGRISTTPDQYNANDKYYDDSYSGNAGDNTSNSDTTGPIVQLDITQT